MDKVFTEPEMLGRKDAEHGQWEIEECMPRRGVPATSIVSREMHIPTGKSELARVIRAHEMMHAKVSPAGDWEQWQKRGIASKEAMTVVEEVRVNYLCKKAGFNVLEHLSDDGETADGERMALTNDWRHCVYMAISSAGTASNKKFLTGVRRHNRLWGKALLDISKRVVKEMQKADRDLASTEIDRGSGLFPRGFVHTERIAEWVDRLAGMEPPKEQEEEKQESESSSAITAEGNPVKAEHSNTHTGKARPLTDDEQLERLKSITPDRGHSSAPHFGELVWGESERTKATKGNLGKKRIASPVGRSPRRLHRYLTDPEKRIFDKVVKGMGGVVLIDGSGSMSLSLTQVREMVEASPGCTVAVYSDNDNCNGQPNIWLLADKGRMVEEMPAIGSGNGVDGPALEWAIKARQRSNAPVIWVSDGGVCGPNQGYSDLLAMQCITLCLKHRVINVEDAGEAITQLNALKAGRPAKRKWAYMLANTYKKLHGEPLLNDEVR